MNKNIIQTVHSLGKTLLISFALHLVFVVTSYALWHSMKAASLSANKLQKGETLTATVEFVAFTPTQTDNVSTRINESAISIKKKHLAAPQEEKNQSISRQTRRHAGSTLSDIIPSPENKHPIYPEEARLIGKEALCIIKVIIAPNGHVRTVNLENDIKNCPAVFMREAKKAISGWRFSPHRSGYIERTVPIKFKLG